MRRIIVPVLALAAFTAAAGVMGGASPTAAAAPQTSRSGEFTSVTSKATELLGVDATGAPRPEFCNAVSGECLVGFIGYDRLSGAIDGTQVNVGSLSINFTNGQGWAASLAHFTGSVRGCAGSGTATLRYDVKLGDQPGKNIGTFSVVEGSGKGGLAGLSGTGSVTATPDPATGIITSQGMARMKCKK